MARTTTTTNAGTSRNRARMTASRGYTRYTNITAASRITLTASNPNAVTSTGTMSGRSHLRATATLQRRIGRLSSRIVPPIEQGAESVLHCGVVFAFHDVLLVHGPTAPAPSAALPRPSLTVEADGRDAPGTPGSVMDAAAISYDRRRADWS